MTELRDDGRLYASAALRNRAALLSALRAEIALPATLLEIASGTGEHAVFLAEHLPGLTVQPSDPDPLARRSIEAWRAVSRLEAVKPALDLDAAAPPWPVAPVDVVLCVNLLHLVPAETTHALVRGAAHVLKPGGLLGLWTKLDGAALTSVIDDQLFERVQVAQMAEDCSWLTARRRSPLD